MRRRGERGQVIVLAALVIAFVLVPIFGVVVDLISLDDESTRADAAAFLAAQAGASRVDTSALQRGVGRSDQAKLGPGAVAACQATVQVVDPGAVAQCTVSGAAIDVVVSKKVGLPMPLPGGTQVRAEHRGGAAVGTVVPR